MPRNYTSMLRLLVEKILVFWMLLQQGVKSLSEGNVDIFRRLVGREAGGVGIKIVLTPF